MKAIILTAGSGTRLEPLTETRPTALIPICGKSILSRTLESLSQVGIQDIAVVINPKYPGLDRLLANLNTPDNPTFTLYKQVHSHGIGHGILAAADFIDERDYFLLAYGDILFSDNMFRTLIHSFNSIKKPVASVSLTANSSDFGIIYMDHEMKINRIIEKPKTPELGNYILAGAFILPGSFFDILKRCSGNVIEAFRILQNTHSLFASIWEGEWIDITYPWSILTANQMVMSQWNHSVMATTTLIEPGTIIAGPVVIEDNVIIKAGAAVLGPCFIGKNSFIGHNALLRENTCIGEGSIIGFGVEVKNWY